MRDGLAYIDDTPKEQMANERLKRIESVNRSNSVEKNMEMWNHLKHNEVIVEGASIRIKMDMTSDNSALRDPSIFRYVHS